MKEETYSAHVLRSARFDPSGSRGGYKLSAKMRARMKKLEKWRIRPSSIKSPKDARQFHGGHATVSKAFLLDRVENTYYNWFRPQSYRYDWYTPKNVMQLCRRSSESDDHVRGAADHRREAEKELGDEEKDDEEEHGSDSDKRWLGKFVAVKKSRMGDNIVLERVLGLALRETEFLVELDHPNIVKLNGFVEDLSKDIIWLVFPWAGNGNLKDFVASRDWEIPERISLIKDVAEGLEYLHNQEPPIRHGDLKSFNVLVNSERVAVITDFGSARRLTEHDLNRQTGPVQNQQRPVQATLSTLSKTITLTGNIYTLRWAAPELLNDDQISLWSDMWALGWITYEVLTNSIPFQDVPKDAVVIERVIKGDLPSLTEHARVSLFQNLCSLMTMCWNSDPFERPTAKDYVRAIRDMPMVVPDTRHGAYSTFSSKLSSEVLIRRGGKGRESGDSAMAFACFTEAHRIYTKVGDRTGEANALDCLAQVHLDREEYSEATAHYSEALEIHTGLGTMEGRASALKGLAQVHKLQKQYGEAIVHYSEALKIYNGIDYMEGRASALWGLAEVYQLRNEYKKAIDIDDRRGRADALSGLAEVRQFQKQYGEAIAHYSKALKIYTGIGITEGRASALWGLAEVYRLRNEYKKAIDVDDRRSRASALWGLAEVRQLQKQYGEAIAHYFKALKIYTAIGNMEGRASALWGLAEVYRLRNEYKKAIDIDDRRGRADALRGLAEVRQLQSKYSEALAHYSEALKIHTGIGNMEGRASALKGLAQVHQLQKQYGEAIAHYSEALKIHTDIGNMEGRASALKGLAQVHQLQKQCGEAITHYSEALRIYTGIGNTEGRASTLWGLAEVYQLRNEYKKAIDIDDRRSRASALWGLAEVRRLQSRYSEAIAHYSEALQIRTDLGDRRDRAPALSGLALVHKLLKEYREAIALYSEVLQICTDIDDKEGRAETLSDLADVHSHQNHHDLARSLYEQAAELFEQSGNGDAAASALRKAARAHFNSICLVEAA